MHRTLCDAQNETEASLLVSALRANGFHPLDVRQSSNVVYAGACFTYSIEVPVEEFDAARKLPAALRQDEEAL